MMAGPGRWLSCGAPLPTALQPVAAHEEDLPAPHALPESQRAPDRSDPRCHGRVSLGRASLMIQTWQRSLGDTETGS